jgi:hypothetical protein
MCSCADDTTAPPRVLITDKLASYGAAKQEVLPNAFLLHTVQFVSIFVPAVIVLVQNATVWCCRNGSRFGTR